MEVGAPAQGWDMGHSDGSTAAASSIGSESVVPHTGSEWHSLLSKAPGFPQTQLALYPSLPPLDPSCTLSTGANRTETLRRTAHTHTDRTGPCTDRQYSLRESTKSTLGLPKDTVVYSV